MTPVATPQPELETREPVVIPVVHPEAPRHRFRLRSTFLLATAIFLFGNACLSFLAPFSFDPYKFNYRGWSWWTFNALRHTDSVSNIALLGSSTMVSAAAGSDANFLQTGLDTTKHHRSMYLEHKLHEAMPGDNHFQTFSLAAPGQVPSDAYITLKGMVASRCRPDIVIYGLAPRDFVDSTLTAPGDTDAFKFLTRLVNIDDVAIKVFRSPFARLDWFFQRLVYCYGYALDIRLEMAEQTIRLINRWIPKPAGTSFTWWDRRRILPEYLPAEHYPDALMTGPVTREQADAHYTDNTIEYIQRYRNPDKHIFKTQIFFLAKLAEFCQKERIELVLVNMPITLQNISLLKPGGYVEYLQCLKEFSMAHNLHFADLKNFERYQRNDFNDSVHLNAFGGQKFFDDVSDYIANNKRLSELVKMSGEHTLKQQSLARPGEPGYQSESEQNPKREVAAVRVKETF